MPGVLEELKAWRELSWLLGGTMNLRELLLCSAAVLGWPLWAQAAATESAAEGAGSSDTGASTASSSLEEVVVTARRVAENLQEVPVAITAFSQQTLTELSIFKAMDLNAAVPGLTVASDSGRSSRPLFAIRGMGQDFGAAAGSVETYFADVPLSGPFQMPAMGPSFYDLQSVQVLKGPQGTLFGRSTTGGAVLFVPQAPVMNEFGGYGRIQAGNYGDYQLEGAVNLPLIDDRVALRLAGFDWKREGYGETIGGNTDLFGHVLGPQRYDNQDVHEGRATLLVTPVDNFQNSTILAYHSDDNLNTTKATVVDPTTALGGAISFLYPNVTKLPPYVADISVDLAHPPTENYAAINTSTYEITPNLTVKNIFGFIDAKGITDVASDVDGSPLIAIDLPSVTRVSETKQTTDELQLQGNAFGGRLSWIGGGLLDQTRQPGGDDIGVILATTNASGGVATAWQQNTFDNRALFGSLTFKITDDLSFTAGERHSWNRVHVLEYTAPLSAAEYEDNIGLRIANVPSNLLSLENNRAYFQGDTYNFGLQYQWTPDVMAYGGYRRGYKQGGFNVSAPAAVPSEQGFQPETDDDFYIGIKTTFDWYGMKGRFNIEGYNDIYHDKQESYLTLTGTGANAALATVTYNVPRTIYRGFDADLDLDTTPWLRIIANYSYIDAYYSNWRDSTYAATAGAPGGPYPNYNLNLAINPVPYVSRNKFSVTTRFHGQLPADLGELVFAPTMTYQDRWYTIGDANLLPQGETAWLGIPYNYNTAARGGDFVRSYGLLNLRFEWNAVWRSKVDLAANVTNATGKVYSLGDTTSLPFGVQSDSFGPPRMITVEASTRF
jgi:iron complex outermembrane recepter protein